jgi:hypothetical protein
MEATSSETPTDFQRTIRLYVPVVRTVQKRKRNNAEHCHTTSKYYQTMDLLSDFTTNFVRGPTRPYRNHLPAGEQTHIKVVSKAFLVLICFATWHEDVWGNGSNIFYLAIDGGEWSALRPGRFTPGDTARGWGSCRGSLDAMEWKTSIAPAQNRTAAVQPVGIPTELFRLLHV